MTENNTQATEITDEGFLASFGITEESSDAPEEGTPTEGTEASIPEPDVETPEAEGTEGTAGTEAAEGPDSSQQPQPNPMNAAFAQMRVQNKQFKDTLEGVASVLGIQDLSDPNTVLEQVNNLVLQAQAKQQNVPADLLMRMRSLEQQNQHYTQQQLQQQALLGFERVKATYELDSNEITEFANQLSAKGINPFVQDVDLGTQYKLLNHDKLMQKAAEKAVAEERARAKKAAEQGTSPNKGSGNGGPPNPDKINSVADLTKFFKQQG